jgi:hypothetical protein
MKIHLSTSKEVDGKRLWLGATNTRQSRRLLVLFAELPQQLRGLNNDIHLYKLSRKQNLTHLYNFLLTITDWRC